MNKSALKGSANNFLTHTKQCNGITLIALIITIIVMLILAGVTINLTLGENGIFRTAQYAGEEHQEAQVKEEIERTILEIQTEEIIKGNELTLQTVVEQLQAKLDITAEIENNEIIGEYKGYNYVIDSEFKVRIEGKVTGISIRYSLNTKEYTNKDVIITITATSTNGEITSIQAPEELTKNDNGTYTATANGEYEFTATDETEQSKTIIIKIGTIDKLAPLDFTPKINELKSTKLVISVDVQDTETDGKNAKSEIDRYEYYVSGTKYESKENTFEVTGLSRNTTYSIYVNAFDKAGNNKKSATITATTNNGDYATLTLNGLINEDAPASDTMTQLCYDNDYGSYQVLNPGDLYIKIDPECWGKYITVYCASNDSYYGCIGFGSEYQKLDKLSTYIRYITGESHIMDLKSRSVLIPEGSYWAYLSSGTMDSNVHLNVYEVWCSEEDLTGTVY